MPGEPPSAAGCLGGVATHRLFRVALGAIVLLSGCTAPVPRSAGTPSPTGCGSVVRRDALPAWARTGFGDPSPSGIPYVPGARGDILGVLFGYPLAAPPPTHGRANKILWVSRV